METEEKQFKVKINYTSSAGSSSGIAYVTEDDLEAIISGQSKKFIRAKTWWLGKDYEKEFYVNIDCITEILVDRELSKTE